jgi:hypothetical protein
MWPAEARFKEGTKLTEDKRHLQGRTSTVTEETETNFEALTPEEEKVLRMRHGLSEDDNHSLKFALGANEEAQAKLAMMEKNLVDAFQWGETTRFEVTEDHIEAKAKIIEKLRDS